MSDEIARETVVGVVEVVPDGVFKLLGHILPQCAADGHIHHLNAPTNGKKWFLALHRQSHQFKFVNVPYSLNVR